MSDENFNYKRDKLLYEKELKTKNQIIQNLLGNTSALKKRELQKKLNEYESKTSNINKGDYLKKINYVSKNKFNEVEEEEENSEKSEEEAPRRSKNLQKNLRNSENNIENGGQEVQNEKKKKEAKN